MGYNSPMEIIYIDSLFFINLLTDYLLCLCTGRICGVKLKRLRYFLAALLGALYSVAVFLPSMGFLASPVMKLAAGLSMALIAFAGEKNPFRCAFVFLAVSAAFGGALWALGLSDSIHGGYRRISTKLLLSSFTLCYSLGILIFRCKARNMARRRVEVKLGFMGKDAEFMALLDTGNSLSDPLSGAPVMVVSPHALKNILGENTGCFEELSPVELIEYSQHIPELKGKLRLIPYSALGVTGTLPVFRPESLTIDGKEDKELLAAISKSASGDGFEALI